MPTITAKAPADAATNVPRTTTVQATFSRAMTPSTLTSSSFTLTPSGGSAVPATVSYNTTTNVATLTPSAPLSYSTSYTARVANTVTATDGTPLAAAVTWASRLVAPVPPTVTTTTPAAGATGASPATSVSATFSRAVDPATLSTTTFTLRAGTSTPVAATVTYNAASATATLTPTQQLAFSTTYTARLETAVTSTDDVSLSAPVTWSFTTAAAPPPPPTVTSRVPAAGATGVSRTTTVDAVFSRAMDATSITAASVTLTGPGSTAVPATVAYTSTTTTVRLTPSSPLAYSTVYTAKVSGAITAADGTPMGTDDTWTFTTAAPPPPPSVISATPAEGSSFVARSTTATAVFSRDMDPATITGASVTLTGPGGAVPASVTYDQASRTAMLTPNALLAGGTTYTAAVSTAAQATDGTPLSPAVNWSFTTAACPCSLFPDTLEPTIQNASTQDGRSGAGPWSYELGVKITVDQPMLISAIRYYRNAGETGTHIGRVWSAAGTQLASVTFANETASGWQRQTLATPIALTANTTYVVSVNANSVFGVTPAGLATAAVSGPLQSVVGSNGVFGAAAGTFPTGSYNNGNYFTDLEVIPNGDVTAPTVTGRTPASGATNVAWTTDVRATFSRPMDAATITGSTMRLTTAAGTQVAASVTYDSATQSAVLTPSAALAPSTTYTVTLTTGIRASDAMPLASPVAWSFTTVGLTPPTVTSTVPAANATGVAPSVRVDATFSKAITASTVNSGTFTLTGPSGAVAGTVTYDAPSTTARLQPAAALAAGSYTARLDGTITATDGAQLGTAVTWSFTVPAANPPLALTDRTPAAGATGVSRDGTVSAVFNRDVDATTVTTSTFTLTGPGGAAVASTVSYDAATRTARLTPSDLLAASTLYTAQLSTGVRASNGDALPASVTWTFTTGTCACSFFANTATPTIQNAPTQDGRSGSGPWSYELGVKVTATQATQLTAIRFFKTSQETGTHVGRVWAADGTLIAQVTFTGESASGWQRQNLATPLTLSPGQVYTISVNANAFFSVTPAGLASQLSAGDARTVLGSNGVFAAAAGVFPTQSYNNGNYFVDLVVR